MRLIKIAVGSLDPTVGAVRANTDKVIDTARRMADEDVTVGCFTEQVIGGYPPEDLIQWQAFVSGQRRQLERLAEETSDLAIVLVVGLAVAVGGRVFNVAGVLHRGRVLGFVPKEKLPTYNVFYEARIFAHGAPYLSLDADGVPLGDRLFAFDFGTLAAEVCEDAWSPDGPMRRRSYSGAELTVNVSSSPYRVGVVSTRREMLSTRSADNQATLVYANTVGAQDGLIFDGGGYVFQNGRLELDAPRFSEGFSTCVVDLDRTRRMRTENSTWRFDCERFLRNAEPVTVIRASEPGPDRSRLAYPAPPRGAFFLPPDEPVDFVTPGSLAPGGPAGAGDSESRLTEGVEGGETRRGRRSAREAVLDDLYEALALGVKDYYVKTGAFRGFGIAVSGGRDSLLSLLVLRRAVQLLHPDLDDGALGARMGELVTAFWMPSRHSTVETHRAASTICEELGVTLREVSIDEAFERELAATRDLLGGEEPDDVTRQNIQARIRGARMWNWANTSGALFVQTGDMSERAVGYTTIGGDLEGALSIIGNVPKTVAVALLGRLHDRFGWRGIALTLETEPGPELAARQHAEDELMPFPVLDACLYLYAGEKLSPGEVAAALRSIFPEHDAAQLAAWAADFATRFSRSIYKWVQAPLSLHVGSLDLDRERALQLPVVQSDEWQKDDV